MKIITFRSWCAAGQECCKCALSQKNYRNCDTCDVGHYLGDRELKFLVPMRIKDKKNKRKGHFCFGRQDDLYFAQYENLKKALSLDMKRALFLKPKLMLYNIFRFGCSTS